MLSTRARCLLTLMFVLAAVCSAHAADIPLWGRFETVIENSTTYANPFRDVELDAFFTSPSGRTVKFFGYYDGDGLGGQEGNAWKLRFMPDEVGVWSYAATFSDGTPGCRGIFSCIAKGAEPGPLRIDGTSLRFADGSPFFPRSYYFSEAFSGTSPHWESGVRRFFGGQYRYNLCCTTFWQGRLLERHHWNNLPYNGFYPIHGGDYTRLDVAAWKHVDEVLRQLESCSAVWFNFDGFAPNVGGDMGAARGDWESQKIYLRNAVARLAPYWNVTWNVAFEWREFMSAEQVRRIADYTRSLDPWAHPITVHDQGGLKSAQEITSQLHVDFVTLQYDAGKCGDALTANLFVQQFGGRVPVYAHEVCWEAASKLDADAVRRGGWGVALAGGILNYAEMFDGPNKGRPKNYGDGKALPYLEIMFDFLETLPHQEMRAHNELVNDGCICLAKPGSCYVCFAPSGGSIDLYLPHGQGPWAAQWLNPRTGEVTPCGVTQPHPGAQLRLHCPTRDDWLLYVHKEEQSTMKTASRQRLYVLPVVCHLSTLSATAAEPPYPRSDVIEGITWHWDTHRTAAPGSDLWPVIWGPDGHLYAAWGDGGGFGGTNSEGRVSMGLARIEGQPEAYRGVNVNGGKDPEHPGSFPKTGKTGGILFVDGILYARLNMQDGKWPDVNHALIWSEDLGATWKQTSWVFPKGPGKFQPSRFLNFGKDYTGVPPHLDGFVYIYGAKQEEWGESGETYLARIPKDRLREREAYEFFTGLISENRPAWSMDVTKLAPVFAHPNGATPATVAYMPTLKRYLLASFHTGPGQLGIFDAPQPWGPWTTVAYYEDWGGMKNEGHGLNCEFPQKWMNDDGRTLWCVFSVYGAGGQTGIEAHDRFNLVKVSLSLKGK